MRVGVTGGKGFIGRRVVGELRRRGDEVVILSRRNEAVSGGARVVVGDLTDTRSELAAFVNGADAIVHCAGEINDVSAMRRLHLDGTARLLEAATAEGARAGRALHWVQLSSVGAYGPPRENAGTERVITEDSPTNPSGEYEVTKTLSDNEVLAAAHSGAISATIVRPSSVIAADMPNDSVRALARAIACRLFVFVGPPGAVANYVHADDVAGLLALCTSDSRAKGQIFNLSDDCAIEVLVYAIATTLGVRAPVTRLPAAPLRALGVILGGIPGFPLTRSRIDALTNRTRYPYTKAERVLGFIPRKRLPEVIGEVAAAVQCHG